MGVMTLYNNISTKMANDAIANTVHFDVGGGVGAACDSGAKQHNTTH